MYRRLTIEHVAIAGAYVFALVLWATGFWLFTARPIKKPEATIEAQGNFEGIGECLTSEAIKELEDCPASGDLYDVIEACSTKPGQVLKDLENCQ